MGRNRPKFASKFIVKQAVIHLILVLLLAISWPFSAKAQNAVSVHGLVTDSTGHPLPLVNIILIQQSKLVIATVTDDEGRFELRLESIDTNRITLNFSCTGFKPESRILSVTDSSLLRIILLHDKHLLGEVRVNSRQQLISRAVDRYIVNVENSFLANGRSALEVLQNTPGIRVDANAGISIKGTSTAMVMINDVVQRMSTEELLAWLSSLRSEEISRIEIIHNPPSEYEAAGSGGIVHIILKRTRKDGLNGTVNTQYRQQGGRFNANAGTSVNLKLQDLYINFGTNFSRDSRYIYETASIDHIGDSKYDNNTDRFEHGHIRQYRLGVSYDLSKNHWISVQGMSNRNDFFQDFITNERFSSGGNNSKGRSTVARKRLLKPAGLTFNYTWRLDSIGSTVKFIADYSSGKKKEINYYTVSTELNNDDQSSRSAVTFATDIYSTQADYLKVLKHDLKISAGGKYVSISRNNGMVSEDFNGSSWVINPQKSDDFLYEENLLMLYSSFDKTFGNTSAKIGLRMENTRSNAISLSTSTMTKRKYTSFFPSIFLVQQVGDNKTDAIYLNYSRRLTRPGLGDLNPARFEYSNSTAMQGNPQLLPEFTHNFSLGYRFGQDITTDFFYTLTKDAIFLSANPGPGNFIDYRPENIGRTNEFGINFSGAFKLLKQWTGNTDASLYQTNYNFRMMHFQMLNYSIRLINLFDIDKTMQVDLATSYRSASRYSNLRTASVVYTDIGVSKKLYHSRIVIRFLAADIFNTSREKELTIEDNTRLDFYRKRPTRTFSISLRYNFQSGKKFNERTLDQSNSTEKGRVGS